MIPDGTYTGVIDRIEDDLATIELESEDGDLYELTVDAETLPADTQEPDTVLELTLANEQPTEIMPRPDETAARETSAQDRFDRLSQRLPQEGESDDQDDDTP